MNIWHEMIIKLYPVQYINHRLQSLFLSYQLSQTFWGKLNLILFLKMNLSNLTILRILFFHLRFFIFWNSFRFEDFPSVLWKTLIPLIAFLIYHIMSLRFVSNLLNVNCFWKISTIKSRTKTLFHKTEIVIFLWYPFPFLNHLC